MATSYTSLLGLALPVTGELSGTWGDTVNDYITQYLDAAVAGTQTISGSLTAVTLSKTTSAALTQAGSGATGSSQYQIINCTGNPASLLTITVPAASKAYLVLNNTSTNQSVKVVGTGPTTGVTIAAARCALIAWNGTDFELVASTDVAALQGLGAGVATFLGNPTSANLAAAVTDETGSGALVFATSPTLTTPTLGAATATSINKVAITAPATSATLTIANGKTLTANNSITLAGTDATTMTFPTTSATLARTDAAQTFTGTQTFSGAVVANGNVTLGDATSDTITATGRFNTDLVPSTDNARDLGTSSLKWKQIYATTFTENGFGVVSQTDIGSAPNEIPLNQYLGNLAYQDAENIAGPVGVGGNLTLNGGTANGVAYLNASKVLTTGSALVFDGTNLGIGVTPSYKLDVTGNTRTTGYAAINTTPTGTAALRIGQAADQTLGTDYSILFSGVGYSGGIALDGTSMQIGQNSASRSLTFHSGTSFAERMRINASGNVGIGTSSPSAKLGVDSGATATSAVLASTATTSYSPTTSASITNARLQLFGGSATNSYTAIRFSHAGSFEALFGAVQTAAGVADFIWQGYSGAAYAERMRLDSSGNLGLGVTPSVWSASYKALQFGSSAVMGRTSGSDSYLIANAYLDSGGNWTYYNTAAAAYYRQNVGTHAWFIAPSGTAGNAISFTQAMTLHASGGLSLGSTTDPGASSFGLTGTLNLGNWATSFQSLTTPQIYGTATGGSGIFNEAGHLILQPSSSGALRSIILATGNGAAERVRVDPVGNVQVQTGAVVVYQPAPASISTTATLTNANIQAQIINTTGTSYTVTMPLGTTLETLVTWATTDLGYDFSVINTASGTITMAANTGVTTLGALTIATGTSAQFRIRRTAANTFVLYRLS